MRTGSADLFDLNFRSEFEKRKIRREYCARQHTVAVLTRSTPRILRVLILTIFALGLVQGLAHGSDRTTKRRFDSKVAIEITKSLLSDNDASRLQTPPSIVWAPQQNYVIFDLPPGFNIENRTGRYVLDRDTNELRFLGAFGAFAVSRVDDHIAYYNMRGDVIVGRLANGRLEANMTLFRGAKPTQQSKLVWSPDGISLVFSSSATVANESTRSNLSAGTADSTQLHIYDTTSKTTETFYKTSRLISDISWRPKHDAIVFVEAFRKQQADVEFNPDTYRNDIYMLGLTKREKTRIAEDVGVVPNAVRLAPAPDGTRIGFFHDAYLIKPSSLGTEPATLRIGGESIEFATNRNFLAHNKVRMIWMRDGKTIAYPCKTGGLFSDLCFSDPETAKTKFTSVSQTEEILAFDINAKTGRMVRMTQDAYDVLRIKSSDLDGSKEKTLLEVPRVELDSFALGKVRPFQWTSVDGLELSGLLVLPINYVENHRYPLVVDIHGGPSPGLYLKGSLGMATPLEWQIWASKGYAVFVADYRFSGAYGLKEQTVRRPKAGNLYDINTDDILTGVDLLVEMGIADPDRLAVIGHSYGATFTNWLLTRTGRFRAAVSIEGHADKRDEAMGYCRQNLPTCLWPLRATSETLYDISAEHSAILRADKIKTPLLLIGARFGAGNPRKSDLPAFADAINATGGVAEYLYFDNDHHVFRKPTNIQAKFNASILWIDRHLNSAMR